MKKKIFAAILTGVLLVTHLPAVAVQAVTKYAEDTEYKVTKNSKEYSCSAAEKLGLTLYEDPSTVVTEYEAGIVIQRIYDEVNSRNGKALSAQKKIINLNNYESAGNRWVTQRLYKVGVLPLAESGNAIDFTKQCTRIRLARILGYYDEFFNVYLVNDKNIKYTDTKSAYARYAYKAGLITGSGNEFNPDGKVTINTLITVVSRLVDNTEIGITTEDVQNALLRSFDIAMEKEPDTLITLSVYDVAVCELDFPTNTTLKMEDASVAEITTIDPLLGRAVIHAKKVGKTKIGFVTDNKTVWVATIEVK